MAFQRSLVNLILPQAGPGREMRAMPSVLETFVASLVSPHRSRRLRLLERFAAIEARASGSDVMTRRPNVAGYF